MKMSFFETTKDFTLVRLCRLSIVPSKFFAMKKVYKIITHSAELSEARASVSVGFYLLNAFQPS
jgi:hypothetical protein